MPVLRLFAAAREAAGEARVEIEGHTVGEVLAEARARFGDQFSAVLERCRVWVNGQPADDAMWLESHDVVAVLPPVSGGAGAAAVAPPEPPAAAPLPVVEPPPVVEPLPIHDLLPEPSAAPPAAGIVPAGDAPGPPPPPPPPPAGFVPAAPLPDVDDLVPPPPPPVDALDWDRRWPREESFEAIPDEASTSVDDLLDRLAGLAPRRRDDRYPEGEPPRARPEPGLAPPPPPPPPPPSPPVPAPPLTPRDDEDRDRDADLWGPGSGPVWSVGERRAHDLRIDWDEKEGTSGEPPPPPPPPVPAREGTDWDRRWDEPLEWESGADDDRPTQAYSEPPGDRGGDDDGPAVRILGPDPVIRPASPPGRGTPGSGEASAAGPSTTQPPLRIVRGDRPPGTSRPPASAIVQATPASTLLADPAGRPPTGPPTAAEDERARGLRPGPTAGRTDGATALATRPATAPKRRPSLPELAVVPQPTRPQGKLGVLWAAVTVGAVVLGTLPVALWLAACAAVATIQAGRAAKAEHDLTALFAAAAGAAMLPLVAAVAGLPLMAVVAVAVAVLVPVAGMSAPSRVSPRDVGTLVLLSVSVGAAVASVVLLREINVHAPLLLLAYAAAYDASAYVVGTGATKFWEGPVAGVLMLIPVTMLSAVFPLESEGSSLLLGVVAALLTPCGPLAASALLGDAEANAPALRRLDSLLVLAPLWALLAWAFVS